MSEINNLEDYKNLALRTESKIDSVNVNYDLAMGAIGAIISAGYILDMVKKNTFYGKPINQDKLQSLALEVAANTDVLRNSATSLAALDSKNNTTIDAIDPRVFHAILGIATESVELLEPLYALMNKDIDELDDVNILEELGDIAWYGSIMVDAMDGDWNIILTTNINKLRARFPEKFDSNQAVTRNLDAERNVLEDGLG